VNQAKPENKELHRHQHECGNYPDYGGAMRPSHPCMDEIHLLDQEKSDANRTIAANESLRQKRAATTTETAKTQTRYQPSIETGDVSLNK
jgi:hypothetical protein